VSIKTVIPLFRIGQVSIDIILVLVIYCSVFITRFEGNIPLNHIKQFWFFLPVLPLIRIITNYIMGLYYHLWKYFGMKEMISVFYSTTLGSIIFVLVVYLTNNSSFPRSIFLFEWALMSIAFLLIRSSRRFSQEIINMQKKSKQRVLIIGAGIAGQHLVTEMNRNPSNTYMPIGYIDDDKQKIRAKINGLKVFGDRYSIPSVVKDWEIDMIIISIPSANAKIIKEIAEISSKTKADVKIIPSIQEIIAGDVKVSHIREIRIEDLLGRKPIIIDTSEISELIKNKTILITGAGGSIGSELVCQLSKFLPEKIILLGHGENSIFKISNKLKEQNPELNQIRVIADIKDKKMIDRVFKEHKPHVVFHAAAHKHVHLMEENLFEAIMNNVYGTKVLVETASKYGVEKFVNISTDKAVNPTSVMGTTKRIVELVVQYYNSISKTEFITVRFGNVIGSRGSVIPIFQEQIKKGGPISVTHPEMTRYFMTIPEAVQLVMQAGALGKGSEIFVLDMGEPIKITELAFNMIKLSGYSENDIQIKFTGIKEGEKLHESLFMESEKIDKTKHEKILVSYLDINYTNFINDLEELFKYTSEFDTENVNRIIISLVPDFKKKLQIDNNLSKKSS
jgi:FlaA1/EpsC-like NDP-sugar epimerase